MTTSRSKAKVVNKPNKKDLEKKENFKIESKLDFEKKLLEKYVLGTILFPFSDNNKNFSIIKDVLSEEDFKDYLNKKLFIAIKTLYQNNEKIDLINIIKFFDSKEINFFTNYFEELLNLMPTSNCLSHYVKILKKINCLVKLRDCLLDISVKINQNKFSFKNDFLKLIEFLKETVNNLILYLEGEEKELYEKNFDELVKLTVERLELFRNAERNL